MGDGASIGSVEDRLDLRRLFHLLQRRIRVLILTFCLVVATGLLITVMQPKVYEAAAIVQLKAPDQQLEERVTDREERRELTGDADVSTEIQVMGSLKLAKRVVRELHLVENAAVNPFLAPKPSLLGRLLGRQSRPLDPKQLSPEQRQKMEDAVVRIARSGLGASRIGTAYSVAVIYRHENPAVAAMLANAFAREYTESQVNDKKGTSSEAIAFLAGKVEELRRQATADFAAVQRYRVDNGLLSSSATALAEQDISVYNQQTASARAEAAADLARLATAKAQLRGGSAGDDVGEALSSSVVSALRTQRAQIGARVADLSARYGSRHPELQRAKEELASVDRQIQEEIDRVISNLEAKAAVSNQRLASLNSSLGSAKGQLARSNDALVTLDDLQRRSQASQGLYESYLARYRQLSASSGTEQSDAKILTEAAPPSVHASPNVMLNMMLATLVGIVLGIVVALATELQFKGMTTAGDVEKRTGLPFLGLVPDNDSLDHHAPDPLSTLIAMPNSVLAETIREIFSATKIPVTGRATVLSIASALPSEGKTTLSALLAWTASRAGVRTLVIDCDIVLRGLSRMVDLETGPGLREVAAGAGTLEEAIRPLDEDGRLAILPITSRAEAGERLTGNGAIQAIVAQVKERFDLVLLDCPPLLAIAEAREIAALADGVILAVHWRQTSDESVRTAARLLPARLASYLGVVLSRVDLKKQQRYAGDSASSYPGYQRYVEAIA